MHVCSSHTIPQVVTVSEDDENTDVFKAAQVNIGLFGVLTEVTVKVDHAFNLEEFRTHTTIDDCLEHLEDLVEDTPTDRLQRNTLMPAMKQLPISAFVIIGESTSQQTLILMT